MENYFSLQRSRISGGGLTMKAYMEGNASIATDMLVKAEKQEATKEAFIGSYASVVTPNFTSVPLKRKKRSFMLKNERYQKLNVAQVNIMK